MLHHAREHLALAPLEQFALTLLPEWPTLADIEALAEEMLDFPVEKRIDDIGTQNFVHGDMLGRAVVIPAGVLAVGAVHKIPGFAFVVGDIVSWTVSAGRERFTGAHMVRTVPGPRVVLAHEDTTWFTVHPNHTGSTDAHVIEDSIVEKADQLMSRRVRALQ